MTTYPTGIVKGVLRGIDGVLNARDAVGAIIQPVYLVTRTWSGSEPGVGTATDAQVQVLPSPGMRNFSQDIRLREGGTVKAGDIILTNISKNKYAEADLDGSSSSANVEKFYLIGDKLYQVINVTGKYVTWDVQVRELTNQTRY